MNWNMMDLAVKHLNISALKEWKDTVLEMSIWMQAIVVGALVLLIGASLLSLFWGLKMTRSARFAAGSTSVFHITLIILIAEYSMESQKALIISAIAGVAAGFIYAFLERVFQFAAGFVFGTVLATWLLPEYFHMKLNAQSGRIWRLVIAIAAGVLFALIAKKLRFILTALEGGIVLGLLCEVFLPVTKIPWISEKLTKAQILNLLPLVIAGVGLLIQLFQWIAMIREQKALQIPSGEERDNISVDNGEESPSEETAEAGADASQNEDDEIVSMAAAEEVLVEKARELALAASRSAQKARLKERYADVAEGMYSAEVAAKRLGITEEEFLDGMKKSGYLPESEADAESEDKAGEGKSEDSKSEDGAAAQTADGSDSGKASEAGQVQSSLTADESSAESKTDAAVKSDADATSDAAAESDADAASDGAAKSDADAASDKDTDRKAGSASDGTAKNDADAASGAAAESDADTAKKDSSSENAGSEDTDSENPSEDDEKAKDEASEDAAGSNQEQHGGQKRERSGRRKHKKH